MIICHVALGRRDDRIRLIGYIGHMKKIDLIFAIARVPADFLMLLLAGTLGYWVRYQGLVTQVRPVFFDVDYQQYFSVLLWTALVGVVVFAWLGLYTTQRAVR